jgi:hypothetical protein
MPGNLEGSEVKWADPAPTRVSELRGQRAEALIGALIASGGLFTGDVISPDAHEGRDSVRSSAGTARRSMLMIIMRYQVSRIRDKR